MKNDKGRAPGFQLLANIMKNAMPDAAGVLDPLLILIQRRLIL